MANANQNRKRLSGKPAVILLGAAALVLVILAVVLVTRPGASTARTDVSAQIGTVQQIKDGGLVIQIKDISETAAFYPVEVDGTKLEVLAVKAPDGTIRTAFNTCQVCYDSGRGYFIQEGNALVCQNCGNRFKMSEVEVARGGCNPVPIMKDDKVVDESTITIPVEFLEQAKAIFANWKD